MSYWAGTAPADPPRAIDAITLTAAVRSSSCEQGDVVFFCDKPAFSLAFSTDQSLLTPICRADRAVCSVQAPYPGLFVSYAVLPRSAGTSIQRKHTMMDFEALDHEVIEDVVLAYDDDDDFDDDDYDLDDDDFDDEDYDFDDDDFDDFDDEDFDDEDDDYF